MPRILATFLGHKERFVGNYQTIQALKDAVFDKYKKYLVKQNVKETHVNFILTYMDEFGNEKLLEDMNVIKVPNNQWFKVFVKRIWDSCCQCSSSFSITPGQITCECQNPECGYQYCSDCVQIMEKSTQNNREIYCMYCGKSFPQGPTQNRLLLDLLWKQFTVKYGVQSLPTTNIMPGTLSNDIDCRIIHLKSLIQSLQGKRDQNIPIHEPLNSIIKHANMLIAELEKVKEKTDKFLSTVTDDVDDSILNTYLDEYVKLLNGDCDNSRNYKHFISICEQLLYYNQKAEFEKYFPSSKKKMDEWEGLLNTQQEFQPKIIEAFKAVQSDLDHSIIPSIPPRVGVIGNISVAKTSLINWLRGISNEVEDDENSENKMTNDNILVSPVRVGKGTYCRLEFEHQYDNGTKIMFVDIEGSTDADTCLKSANYFDEILKADCDLYLMLFDDQFTDIQREWYNYIVNELHRQCWLVQSKVDLLFRNMFKEDVRQDFDSSNDVVKNKYGPKIIEQIRHKVSFDIHGKELPNEVYLTYTSYDKALSKMSYSKFDLEKLLNRIQNLPLDMHANRLQKMAVCAMARVINNCFRRGYVVNVMKYKIAAGIAATIPFGDLIPRYYGREGIRQAFGVNTRSRIMNWWYGTKDEFKDYLNEFNIAVDESGFKTSAFSNTFRGDPTIVSKRTINITSVATKGIAAIGITVASLGDDVQRAAEIGAINATRVAFMYLAAVGVVLTAPIYPWAAVNNGKQMYNYLNRLCDDLIVVSHHVTANIINDNNEIRNSFTNLQ